MRARPLQTIHQGLARRIPLRVLDVPTDVEVIYQDFDPGCTGRYSDPQRFRSVLAELVNPKIIILDGEESWLDNPKVMFNTAPEVAKILDEVKLAFPLTVRSWYQWPALRYSIEENREWMAAARQCPKTLESFSAFCVSCYQDYSMANVAGVTDVLQNALSLGKPVYAFWSPRVGGVGDLVSDSQCIKTIQAIRDATFITTSERLYHTTACVLWDELIHDDQSLVDHYLNLARKVAAE